MEWVDQYETRAPLARKTRKRKEPTEAEALAGLANFRKVAHLLGPSWTAVFEQGVVVRDVQQTYNDMARVFTQKAQDAGLSTRQYMARLLAHAGPRPPQPYEGTGY